NNLPVGAYQSLIVNSGGTVVFAAGQYFFQSLSINGTWRAAAVTFTTTPTTREPTGGTRIYVQNSMGILTPALAPTGSGLQTVFIGFAGNPTNGLTFSSSPFGTPPIATAPFLGTLVAPNASVTLGAGSPTTFTGSFYARVLSVGPDNRV